jgi:hypothetical protein
MSKTPPQEWLLIFYSVPSHPVSNRMKIWRKLAKAGAVQLKGAVYVLPATDEREELLQWLMGEVKAMGGDGAFVKTAEIMTMDETDIRELFLRQAEKEYRGFEKRLDVLERKVQSVRKGTRSTTNDLFGGEAAKLGREFAELRKRDFFQSPLGAVMQKRMQALESGRKGLGRSSPGTTAVVAPKRISQYSGRAWVTRKKPFVDRMASAWLIRKFIDGKAVFKFIDDRELAGLARNAVSFDMHNAQFTHAGDLCTFEVLVKAFNIKDKAVRKIAELVHELDVQDDKYTNAESTGVENVLRGIRKTAQDDTEVLERGMTVFEMLYQSKS